MDERKKVRKRRLKSLNDVRKYLGDLINQTRNGDVDPGMASRLGYLLNILRACISEGELEVRLRKLEERVEMDREGGRK